MYITNISEAKSSLSSLLAQVQKGEEVIIGKAGKPIAKIIPYEEDTQDRVLSGSWAGKVKVADDFDELPAEVMDVFMGNGKL